MVEYNLSINSVKVADVGEFKNVVKQIDFTISGVDQGQSFSLPGKVTFETFDQENFTSFDSLTEEQAKIWVENSDVLDSYKAHIALVLEKMVAEAALQPAPLPWSSTPVVFPENYVPPPSSEVTTPQA